MELLLQNVLLMLVHIHASMELVLLNVLTMMELVLLMLVHIHASMELVLLNVLVMMELVLSNTLLMLVMMELVMLNVLLNVIVMMELVLLNHKGHHLEVLYFVRHLVGSIDGVSKRTSQVNTFSASCSKHALSYVVTSPITKVTYNLSPCSPPYPPCQHVQARNTMYSPRCSQIVFSR
jgi:hypothetical protein